MPYVDGFVIAVPTARKQEFIDHAGKANSVFKELGATRILECWGDDVPDGKFTDFRKAVQAKRRDGRLLLDGMARQGDARRRHAQDGRTHEDRRSVESGEEPDAIRRPADDLRRVRAGGRALTLVPLTRASFRFRSNFTSS